MKKLFITCLLAAIAGIACHAQAQPSTVCHDDGTVTFYYQNDSAREVLVDVQFAGRHKMTRDDSGRWTATLGPAAPDMYPYCFVVDGVSIMDPLCDQYFPNEGFKNSLLEIPSRGGSLLHDIRPDVPHGSVQYIHYYSKSLGATNQAVVYLPPSYMTDFQKKYPVFYLISGTTDTEEVYYKVGRVNYILDNLLAEKKAKEMIIVLPYGNPMKLLPKMPDNPMAMGDVFGNDLVGDLMPYIEKNYRTVNNRDHRAIGGFSRGGNQALSCGLRHLDLFSYLCSYSSFTSTDIPGVYDNAADTNKKLHLFWLGIGTDDFLYGTGRDYMEFLDKKGIRSVKEFTSDKYGHTWMNAKYFLGKTLPLLFNKKASEETMKNGQPAPAAKGDEKPFTPEVMARLFPKPIVSPEYTPQGTIFRMKAPEAHEVYLETEMTPPMAMTCDSTGVWSVMLSDFIFDTYEYCFNVDGTRMADPQNMYLSPSKGLKRSIAESPASPFSYASMKDIQHGTVSYDLNQGAGWYFSPMKEGAFAMPNMVRLVPGSDDTMESWFTVGGAAAIADRLIADGKLGAVVITTGDVNFGGMPMPQGFEVAELRADDYKTWGQRRRALFRLLTHLKPPKMPDMPFMPQ